MGCKACERDAESIYKDLAESTGTVYYKYKNENGNQIILEGTAIGILQKAGKLPKDIELTQL